MYGPGDSSRASQGSVTDIKWTRFNPIFWPISVFARGGRKNESAKRGGAKTLKYTAPNFKYMAPKHKYIAPKLKYVAPKFK